MRILIVDDDPFAGELAGAILESEGHDCQLADSGLDALERLGETPDAFDVIISDMHMPLVSGLDLFSEIQTRGLRVPFVLLTGDDPAPLQAQAPGLAACLMKDASLESSLPAAIARL